MSYIQRIEIIEFKFEVVDIGLEQAAAGVGNMAYNKGNSMTARRFAVRLLTEDGFSGEYVTHWVVVLPQLKMDKPHFEFI